MYKTISLGTVVKPQPESSDLSLLAGRWNIGLNIKLINPVRIVKGPVQTVFVEKQPFNLPRSKIINEYIDEPQT